VRLTIEDRGLPCSAQEVVDAVAVRLPLAGPADPTAISLRVRAEGLFARLTVGTCGDTQTCKERLVSLEDLPSAKGGARRIALAAVDLVLAEATPPEGAARPSASRSEAPHSARLEIVALPELGAGSNLGAEPGIDTSGKLYGLAMTGLSVRLHRGLRLAVELGYGGGPSASVGSDTAIALHALPARLGLGWRFSWARVALEPRLAGVLWGYWLRGAAERSGLLGGVSASLWLVTRVARRLAVVTGLGLDAFANRDRFTVHGVPGLATERVAFWLGVGVAGAAVP
jgi:hypothetical protein